MPTDTMTLDLPVKLSHDEYEQRSKRYATQIGLIADIEAEKKAKVKSYAERIETAKLEAERLRAAVLSGTELRPVTCKVVPNHARGCFDVVHPDTGEVVRTEPMSTHDKQLTIDEAAATKAREGKDYEPKVGDEIDFDDNAAPGAEGAPPTGEAYICSGCGMAIKGVNTHRPDCAVAFPERFVDRPQLGAPPSVLEGGVIDASFEDDDESEDDESEDDEDAPDYSKAAEIATEQLDEEKGKKGSRKPKKGGA